MKSSSIVGRIGLVAWIASTLAASAAVTVTVEPGKPWLGFMNVFELPANGGGFVFGSGWGTADLRAEFSGATLTLSPNTIGDPNDFWYIGGGAPGSPGNKIMGANMYVEINGGELLGQTLNFTGFVSANSFTAAHITKAFIKDFAPDYSSFVGIEAPITNGVFSLSLPTINDPARHVQYGFETTGVNVWSTDVAPFGSISITAIPEPGPLGLASVAGLFWILRRRQR